MDAFISDTRIHVSEMKLLTKQLDICCSKSRTSPLYKPLAIYGYAKPSIVYDF